MSSKDVLTLIKKSLKETLDREIEITEDTDLVKEKILDSLDGIRFLFEVEQLTDVKFPDSDVSSGRLWKISELVRFITSASERG